MDGENNPQPDTPKSAPDTPIPAPIYPEKEEILSAKEKASPQEGVNVTVNLPPERTRLTEWAQVSVNVILAVIGIFAICIYGGQLHVMKGQLNEMQAEQRPWVYADIRPNGAVYKTQSGGFGFPFALTLNNSGHLPAQSASPYVDGHTSKWGYDHHESLAEMQKKTCEDGIAKFRAGKEREGATVFPNHPQMIGEGVGISQQEWEAGSLTVSGRPQFGADVEVAGCVIYSYGDKIGTTGFAFSFAWDKGRQPPFNTFALPVNPLTVPASEIVLMAWPEASVWQAN